MSFAQLLVSGPLNRMAHVHRYSSHPVIRKESVAEHSYYVATYSLMIIHHYELEVDTGLVLTRALVHDVDEGLTGDFVRSFKYSSPALKEMLDQHGAKFTKEIFSSYGLPTDSQYDLLQAWSDAKTMSTEGDVVALADFICVVAYALAEFKMGNEFMLSIMQELLAYANLLLDSIRTTCLKDMVVDLVDIIDTCIERGAR